jgi:PAS domain S-box-containing protein
MAVDESPGGQATPRWREEVQTRVSRLLFVFATPVGLLAAVSSVRSNQPEQGVAVVIGLAMLAWATWGPSSHSVRASITLGAVLGVALSTIAFTGWTANTAALLCFAAILALLTLGFGAAAFALAASTAAYAIAAYAVVVHGWDPNAVHRDQVGRVLRLVAIFPIFAGGAVLAVHYIIRRLEHSIASLNDLSAALRRSEAQFRELFDNVPDGVFQTSRDGRILMANPAYARLLGFDSPDAARDFDVRDVYERSEEREALLRMLDSHGEARNVEIHLRRRDGAILTTLLSVRVIRDERGAVSHFEGTLVDITERKHLEDQLLQARKMEAIGRLAGGIAHDFNNLLTAILGFAELIRDREPISDRQRKDLNAIETAAHSASHLTRQLLAFSRKQVLQPTVVDLNAVVTRARSLLGRVIGEDIDIVMRLADHELPIVIDAGQIEQVIMNLGINARDAMPRGGRLTIETFAADTGSGEVGLSVVDTGTGIDPGMLTHIFEPFFTTKEPGRGTGLGLATVHGIVEQSGGRILVESEPGHGTRVQIRFPRATASLTLEKPISRTPAARGAETILLVEDEADVREVAREILTHVGYTVLEASSAEEAAVMYALHGKKIDLVLTDVIMPATSGPALAERFRAASMDVPFLFMSGYAADMLDSGGIAAPDVPFLAKPFTVDRLLSKVRDVLDAPR